MRSCCKRHGGALHARAGRETAPEGRPYGREACPAVRPPGRAHGGPRPPAHAPESGRAATRRARAASALTPAWARCSAESLARARSGARRDAIAGRTP